MRSAGTTPVSEIVAALGLMTFVFGALYLVLCRGGAGK
jgi:hypothetical protein